MARVLVLGGYGLIGAEVMRHLANEGHDLRAIGRDRNTALRVFPQASWEITDVARMQSAHDWTALLRETDFVVNCTGALQSSSTDDLDGVHHKMLGALAQACKVADVGLIQISAVGAEVGVRTEFLASKAQGDAAIKVAGPRYWIFRPGLVLAKSGFGGSQLLRMLAAIPLVQPLAVGQAQVQTVSASDIARCVERAITGKIAAGTEVDLVEATPHRLEDVVAQYRRWLGFPPARHVVHLPNWAVHAVAKVADGLAKLGWRSSLRSTSIAVLEDGVTGVAGPEVTGPVNTLAQTLAATPARYEDRVSARMALLTPLVLAVLAVFWLLSGIIGVVSLKQASQVLTQLGWPDFTARGVVLFWSAVDLALGVMILYRPYAKRAAWLMILVSLIYLVSATVLTPYLWLDPLGPLVKTLPGIALALVARALLEVR